MGKAQAPGLSLAGVTAHWSAIPWLGNLALICAKRNDVILTVNSWLIFVKILNKEESSYLILWDDDEKISNLIHELNFGAYAPEEKE